MSGVNNVAPPPPSYNDVVGHGPSPSAPAMEGQPSYPPAGAQPPYPQPTSQGYNTNPISAPYPPPNAGYPAQGPYGYGQYPPPAQTPYGQPVMSSTPGQPVQYTYNTVTAAPIANSSYQTTPLAYAGIRSRRRLRAGQKKCMLIFFAVFFIVTVIIIISVVIATMVYGNTNRIGGRSTNVAKVLLCVFISVIVFIVIVIFITQVMW